jgi:putative transposase
MKRARFTEDQIIGVLKEHEAGAKTADLARKHGVSEATLYNWKAKYGGTDVCEAKRLNVNRRHESTPPQSIISMFYRADRRRDPTPNDSL